MEQQPAPAGSPEIDIAARKRAAVELIAQHGNSLRRTARRYSLDPEDAEDAYQRSLEILLTKAPNLRMNELVRWTHTVVIRTFDSMASCSRVARSERGDQSVSLSTWPSSLTA